MTAAGIKRGFRRVAVAFMASAVLGSFLSGCGPTAMEMAAREANTAAAQRDGQIAICRQNFAPIKPATPRQQCIFKAMLDYAELGDQRGATNLVIRTRNTYAQILVAAERFDAGKTTQAEYEAEVAKVIAAAAEEQRKLEHDEQIARSAGAQADALSNMDMRARQRAIMDAARGRY